MYFPLIKYLSLIKEEEELTMVTHGTFIIQELPMLGKQMEKQSIAWEMVISEARHQNNNNNNNNNKRVNTKQVLKYLEYLLGIDIQMNL